MGFITICLRLKPLVPPPGAEPMPIFKPKGWRELTLRLLPCWCVYLQAAVCTLCARGTSVQWGVQMGGCGCAAPEVCVGCIASCPQTYRCEGCMCISVNMQLNFCMCWRKVQESTCRSLVGFASWPHCMQITTGLDVAGPGATPGLAGHWAQHPKEGKPTWRETGSSQLCLWCCSKHNTCNNKIQLSSTARCELHLPLASCVPNSDSEFLGNSLFCYFLPSSLFLVSFYFFPKSRQETRGSLQVVRVGTGPKHRSQALPWKQQASSKLLPLITSTEGRVPCSPSGGGWSPLGNSDEGIKTRKLLEEAARQRSGINLIKCIWTHGWPGVTFQWLRLVTSVTKYCHSSA